jgi:PTS system mannose-specific IIA component
MPIMSRMAAILLVAHAPLASALQSVAAHVYPEAVDVIGALDVAADADVLTLRAPLQALIQRLGAADARGEVLLLCDCFGATPCNAALAAADGVRQRVVAGVNVPMLWRAICYRHQPLDELVTRAVAGAGQGVMHVAVPRRQNQPSPPGRHDPQAHSHQQ